MTVPLRVDECLADIQGRLRPSAAYPHPLLESLGLVVDREVTSPYSIPAVDCAAVDGFAVRAIDTQGASVGAPVLLSPAMASADSPLSAGSCVEIAAGLPMPRGTDAVLPRTETMVDGAGVRVLSAAYTGRFVRRAGDDVAKGQALLRAGEVVGPRHLGFLASLGVETVSVVPRPRVVVISAGAELVEPGRRAGIDQVRDANSYLLAATVRAAGAIAYRVHVPTNDPAQFTEVLDDQLVRADLVVITGGQADAVRAALGRDGGVRFREVAMHPGPTLGFGLMGHENTPIFVLPRDPVAAYVSFTAFVAPTLRRLAGRTPEERPLFRAQLTEDIPSYEGKRHYVRASFTSGPEGARVRPVGGVGDLFLGGLAEANALIVLREDVGVARAGDPVPIVLLDREF